METLYKFDQFNIKQVFKLGEYNNKTMEIEKPLRPKGNLVTQIYEHKDVITCLENIADKFLVSGSYDGTIKVFNVKKIQVNITCQSEGTYEINPENAEEKVRVNSLSAFENTYTVAAATNKGNIRVFQIQRMRSKSPQFSKLSRAESSGNAQVLKYHAGGEIQKIVTFKNQNKNQCFCFITTESILGVQDIRMRTKTMTCNLGKERGIPRALAFSTFGPSILIGTLDGYVLTYDIRCNLVSNIRQLTYQNVPVTITGIYPSPYTCNGRNLFAFTYPSKSYEFSYFDLYNDQAQFSAERHYTSSDREEIITVPSMVNKTKEENFKLCNNSLTQKKYYKHLADFRNFKILQYLSDPFTVKESKIREVWMDRCKHRYNQISSIYNKKSLPFLEHLPNGILTNMNPSLACSGNKKSTRNLSVLVEKMEPKEYYETEKLVTCKPSKSKIYIFPDEENADFLTCSKTVNGMVFTGGWDSVIKIYK